MQKILNLLLLLLRTTLLILVSPLAVAESQLLKLDDFSYGANLAPAESEFRRFSLSPVMIKDLQRRDFGDVHVFDANNELMPTLVRQQGGSAKVSKQVLTPSAYRVSGETSGYILDRGANLKPSVKSLNLRWSGTEPRVAVVRVEHSADQKVWEALVESEAVINFNFEGSVLKQNSIDINNYTQRYIKLTFIDDKQTPTLSAVDLYTTDNKLPDESWLPAGQLQPDESMPNAYRFSVSKGVSPHLLKFSFGKLNTVLSASLFTYDTVNGKPERNLVMKNFDAYVVSMNNKVVKSKPVDVSQWQSSEWLVSFNPGSDFSESDLPGVTVSYPNYEVIYASDGEAPYTVVWGNSSAGAPMSGDLVTRIKDKALVWKDIAVTKPEVTLDNASLTQLMKSRQTPWLMLSLGLLVIIIVAIASMVFYKRSN